jgi:non-ribosomal peptide synthetase component F
MVDIHHIVSDGLSLEIFVKEFISLYRGEELLPLPIQYKDFAYWQNSLKLKAFMEKQEEYWLKQFRDRVPVLELPTDFERPPEKTYAGRVINFEINSEETRRLNDLAREQGVTLFMVLAALFNVLLAKISGMEDIVVGTPVAGRRHADLQQVIGMFVNTLPLRNYPSGEKAFGQFLGEVKVNCLEAFNNQDYQFEDLVEALDARGDSSRNPIFDVMFALQNKNILSEGVPGLDTTNAGLTFKPFEFEIETVKFDLLFYAFEVADKIEFAVKYSTGLFKEETIRQVNRYFLEILINVMENPGVPISGIRLISREEEGRLIDQLKEKKGIGAGDTHRDETAPENRPKAKQAEFDF